MVKIIIGVVLVLALVGGGGGYWYKYLRETPEEIVEEVVEPDPVFVEFNPIQIPLIYGNSIQETYVVSLALETTSDLEAEQIVLYSPRLNDAFLQVLYGTMTTNKLVNGTLDMRLVKARILRAGEIILGEGVITDVLVQAVGQRSNGATAGLQK